MAAQHFVEIILPLALPGTFTYHLTDEERNVLQIGQRVSVPFGSKKLYTGIVHSFHDQKPELYKTKPIHSILDDYPLVTKLQIQFWEWIADYYMCTLGDVYRNAFPTGLKWESETFIKLNPQIDEDFEELNEIEKTIVNALAHKGLMSIHEIADLIEQNKTISIIKNLWESGWIQIDEVLQEKYKPKVERFVKVNPELKTNEAFFKEKIDSLKNANKQRQILLQLIVEESQTTKPIKISSFLKSMGATHAIINVLAEKELVDVYELNTSRIEEKEFDTQAIHNLSIEQETALKIIEENFKIQKPVLLHGVTGSGKTEVYLRLIEEKINQGKTVLFLLPEISLTTQLVQRIQKHFGELVGVYHSKFNSNERVELWNKTLKGDYRIIIGARSSLFLPFQNLGLIIVDEEHEAAYKQKDSRPFFQARDMALLLAKLSQANILLGSATPSLESYFNAKENRYGFAKLTNRFGEVQLPKIELIDLKQAIRTKEITGDISHKLRDEILDTIQSGKQVIIFQNRRGFAPILECLSCGHSPFCPNCDVPLTLHKFHHQLKCHYCGHTQAKPNKCVQCQSVELTTKGIGTEQIELQLNSMFPKLKVARMDVDTMRRKNAYAKIFEQMEAQEIDILVGTQMLAKGLDFSNVGMVGVIRADSLLNFPDFRAHEKAFQLLTQVAGRAGRREEQGKVFIQTYHPEHQILQNVTTNDYTKTAKDILYERSQFLYPPFRRLIQISFKHANLERVEKTSLEFVKMLKPHFAPNHLLGPEEPSIGRIKNQYIRNVLVKIPPQNSLKNTKAYIQKCLDNLHTVSVFRSVKVEIDVDP